MLAVLGMKRPSQRRREHSVAAGIGPDPRLQRGDRILPGAPRCVIPALDRRHSKTNGFAADGVLPQARAQGEQRGLQFPLGRRCGQQRSDDGKAKPCPAISIRRIRSIAQDSPSRGDPSPLFSSGSGAYVGARFWCDHHLLRAGRNASVSLVERGQKMQRRKQL
jgi:hypothetical protein